MSIWDANYDDWKLDNGEESTFICDNCNEKYDMSDFDYKASEKTLCSNICQYCGEKVLKELEGRGQ